MSEKMRIVLLYLLLVVGAGIHIEGSQASIMLTTAGWMLIGLGIWIVSEYVCLLRKEYTPEEDSRAGWKLFVCWSLGIVFVTWSLEWLGVHTGRVFGRYEYHEMLSPQIAAVPAAIGFSWLTLLLSAAALERRLPFRVHARHAFLRALVIAALLLIFDIVLEPSAVKLGYWRWQDGMIPWSNYLSWFGIGWALAYITLRLDLWRRRFPRIAPHFFIAQLIYFGLVYLA
jgi:putative membrane protein